MFSENCFRSLGFRLRAYAAMKTYCKPYGPYAPLRYCPFTLASLLGRRKKGRGRGEGEKRNREKGKERVPSFSSQSPLSLFPFLPIPCYFWRLLPRLHSGVFRFWKSLSITVCKIRYTHSLIIPDYFVGSSAVEKLKSTVLFSNCLSNNSRILR